MIVFNPLASSSEPAGTDQIWKMQELYLKSVMLYILCQYAMGTSFPGRRVTALLLWCECRTQENGKRVHCYSENEIAEIYF